MDAEREREGGGIGKAVATRTVHPSAVRHTDDSLVDFIRPSL